VVESDKKVFAESVREVLKSYRQECGTFTLNIWWIALHQYDLKKVLNAIGAYCASPEKCKFVPKAGDIVGMITGTKDDRKDLAVLAFSHAIQNVNSYQSVVFDDPAIHHAIIVGFGSWQEFGMFDDAQFKCQEQRRAFLSAYASFNDKTAYAPRLIGISEQDAVGSGLEYKFDTLYIGERKKALAVESGGRTAISGSVGSITSTFVNKIDGGSNE